MCVSKKLRLTICIGALLAPFLLGSARADDNNKNNQYSATFSGFQEIGPLGANETGAIFSPAKGTLTLSVDQGNQFIKYQLTYSGFVNIVTQSHIHFGKEHVAGGIMVFLCANLTAGWRAASGARLAELSIAGSPPGSTAPSLRLSGRPSQPGQPGLR